MKRIFLSVLSTLFLFFGSIAQDVMYVRGNEEPEKAPAKKEFLQQDPPVEKTEKENLPALKNSLGLAAGFTTGTGFSYRFWPKKLGFQLTAGGIKSQEDAAISGGLTVLNKLMENQVITFYAYYSNSIYYTETNKTDYIYGTPKFPNDPYNYNNNYTTTNTTTYKTAWNTGLGLGIQFKIGRYVGMDLMAGWAGYDTFRLILPTGECGMYFKF